MDKKARRQRIVEEFINSKSGSVGRLTHKEIEVLHFIIDRFVQTNMSVSTQMIWDAFGGTVGRPALVRLHNLNIIKEIQDKGPCWWDLSIDWKNMIG